MSSMAQSSKSRRPCRQFTDEFKQQAVRLVLDEGQSVSAVARELDLVASALGNWVKQAQADRTKGRTGLTSAEREELTRLRRENRILQEEREILKKPRPSSRSTSDEICVHRRGEGHAFGVDLVSVSVPDAQRVLRVAAAQTVAAGPARSCSADQLDND
jgi:transposase